MLTARKKINRNNQVSLEILKALIEACHRDLNLFSKYVVKIIDMMLETKDIEIIDLACQVVKWRSYKKKHSIEWKTNAILQSLLYLLVIMMDQH